MDGTVHAVNGISYSLEQGQTLGIVGESGCGKSVSALSVMGLIPKPPGNITAGHVLYRGQDLLSLREEEMERIRGDEIAMVFQDPMTSLNPVLTVGRQIGEGLVVHQRAGWKEAQRQAVELLERVGIPQPGDRYDSYPHQLSGGMRQRVMIAMALSCNPSVLIADEPTTALDVTIQAQIIDLVKELRDQAGLAVVWITHDLGIVAGLADQVIVMYAGFIVERGSVDDIYEHPSHPYTLALLSSLPRVDRTNGGKLKTIPGLPPDLLELSPGCPFAPRCQHVQERCRHENPELKPVGPDHEIACWVDVNTGKER
jgi:oligopeptide transport system ATP-binding protein